jgi:hypothetical protein
MNTLNIFKAFESVCPFTIYRGVLIHSSYSCTELHFFLHGAIGRSGPGPHCLGLTITLRHTTFCTAPLDEGSAQHREHYLTRSNTHKRQIFMLLVGFKPATPANGRPQTHVLDGAATGIGTEFHLHSSSGL